MYPERTRNLWLATSASAGASRRVGIKSLDQRCMIVSSSCFRLELENPLFYRNRAESLWSCLGLAHPSDFARSTIIHHGDTEDTDSIQGNLRDLCASVVIFISLLSAHPFSAHPLHRTSLAMHHHTIRRGVRPCITTTQLPLLKS